MLSLLLALLFVAAWRAAAHAGQCSGKGDRRSGATAAHACALIVLWVQLLVT